MHTTNTLESSETEAKNLLEEAGLAIDSGLLEPVDTIGDSLRHALTSEQWHELQSRLIADQVSWL